MSSTIDATSFASGLPIIFFCFDFEFLFLGKNLQYQGLKSGVESRCDTLGQSSCTGRIVMPFLLFHFATKFFLNITVLMYALFLVWLFVVLCMMIIVTRGEGVRFLGIEVWDGETKLSKVLKIELFYFTYWY